MDEVVDLKREVAHLEVALARTADRLETDTQVAWEQTLMRASAIEKIYTGCERVMALVANVRQGADRKVGGLTRRTSQALSHPFPGVRDGIVSAATLTRLNRLRAFRHRERNSYGIDLDKGIVLDRAKEAVGAFESFEDDVRRFLVAQGFDPSASSE